MMTVFNFIKEWDNQNEKTILNQFKLEPTLKETKLNIKCHFDSDLLIVNDAPFSAWELCMILHIPYETSFGANTFMSKDIILNVSKVRDYVELPAIICKNTDLQHHLGLIFLALGKGLQRISMDLECGKNPLFRNPRWGYELDYQNKRFQLKCVLKEIEKDD